jgi:hypothetical protein
MATRWVRFGSKKPNRSFFQLTKPSTLVSNPAAAAEAAPTYKARTLATGLESPRGVAIAPDGNLVLSEAGRGGNGLCLTGGSGNSVCYGTTGALGLFNFSTNSYSRAITGLPSLARQNSSLYDDATGLNKLTFNGSGQLMGVFGNEGGASPFPGPAGQWFGRTVSIDLAGSTVTPLANITAFEVSNNPHTAAVESNPWDLVVRGSDTFVTYAAGNSLVKADSLNQVSLVHGLPQQGRQYSHQRSPRLPSRSFRPDRAHRLDHRT